MNRDLHKLATIDKSISSITLSKNRKLVIVLSLLYWFIIASIYTSKLNPFILILLYFFSIPLLFTIIGISVNYLEKSITADFSVHISHSRILFAINGIPIAAHFNIMIYFLIKELFMKIV
ncbi:hypothetical protein MNBD_GAMMA12-3823 [hydrothermal vent metagenome]|uniref:Uncharacterized protein n=1 Tax=hydrothermal vent metagenome TaxID=652676 RepID=A0A3B0Y843_9ZZZZ